MSMDDKKEVNELSNTVIKKKVIRKRKLNLKNLDDFEKDLLSGDFVNTVLSNKNQLTPLEIFKNTIIKNRDVLRSQLRAYSEDGLLSMSQLCVSINKKYGFNIKEETLGKWIKDDVTKINPVNDLPKKCLVIEFDADEKIINLVERDVFLNMSIKVKVANYLGLSLSKVLDKKPVVNTDDNYLSLDVSRIGG